MTNPSLPTIVLVLISTVLTACATTGSKNSILPTGLKPMSEIYKEHFRHGKAGPEQAPVPPAKDGGRFRHPASGDTRASLHSGNAGDTGAVFQPNGLSLPKRPSGDGDADLHGTLRFAAAGLDHTFPRLANPTLVMYVYPHLAGPSGAPVPGYATRFTLYDRVEYAAPGEFTEGLSQ